MLIKSGRPIPKPIYNVHNPVEGRLEVESVSHFFLHCHYYSNICSTLLNVLQSIDINLLNQEDDIVVEVLLYGSTTFNN